MQKENEIPALMTYLSPLRIIESSEVTWSCTLDQVNARTYDSGKLATLVGSIDIGLDPPFCLHVGLDGSSAASANQTLAANGDSGENV
jgi:hypothetical protein